MRNPKTDGRTDDQMREVEIMPNYIANPMGSCLISFGKTKVLCTASVEQSTPRWLDYEMEGWLTAEYSMLPGSTEPRSRRERRGARGRTKEIQRLIGRSLRGAVDRRMMPGMTITIDCDVIQADGGTRTASVTGGYVALRLAVERLLKTGKLEDNPVTEQVSAVSVGIVNGEPLLDLEYREDSRADVDLNVVALSDDTFLEVQGTGEGASFGRDELGRMLDLALKGTRKLMEIQNEAIEEGLR